MRTSRIISFLIALAVACTAWAGVISEQQARRVAAEFMSGRVNHQQSLRLTYQAPLLQQSGAKAYYVFNAGDRDGFVIVAGDDRVPAVLGYSDSGTFDSREIPEAMKDWLDGYAAQIAALDEGGKIATHISGSPRIAPLVQAQWSQNTPYNLLTPTLSNGNHPPLGCVATAMAQVLHYWRQPKTTRMPIASYVTETLGLNMPSLPIVSFNWDVMQNTYYTDDTGSAAAQAAAQLSFYCAQSVQMDYDEDGSSAGVSDIPLAMFLYFDFAPTAKYLQRKFYTTQQWETIVLNELAAKRPVIYRGRKKTGGHAFICDGYDGNGMFHINWGWNGSSNGYFLLNVLNPDLQGTGSASGTYGYILEQGLVSSLEPGSAGDVDFEVTTKYVEVQGYINTRTSSSQDFTVTQITHFINYLDDPIDFDFGWGLYQGNDLLKVLDWDTKTGLNSWYYIYPTRTLSFGSGISSGSYRIVPIYREAYTSGNWKPCLGSMINFIEVNIDGNRCTVAGHGAAVNPVYQVNNISLAGNMHAGRPVDVTLDVTNTGNTQNDVIYMFSNNDFVSMGYANIGKNEQGLVQFRFMPVVAGTYNLKFALDEEGTNVIGNKQVTITQMPSANLTGSARALNITSTSPRIITANELGVELTVTNSGSTTYDEDISIKMFKYVYGNTGTTVQSITKHVVIEPQEKVILTFHLDNVMNGWKYFAKAYFYSSGSQQLLANVSSYTIVFPEAGLKGDVNGDGEVGISDINALIDMILSESSNPAGDVDDDGEVGISDINAVIDIILKNN